MKGTAVRGGLVAVSLRIFPVEKKNIIFGKHPSQHVHLVYFLYSPVLSCTLTPLAEHFPFAFPEGPPTKLQSKVKDKPQTKHHIIALRKNTLNNQ